MAEWHQPPDYIVTHWTEELLNLMIEKLAERRAREVEALNGRHDENETVSEAEFLRRAGGMVQVKKGQV